MTNEQPTKDESEENAGEAADVSLMSSSDQEVAVPDSAMVDELKRARVHDPRRVIEDLRNHLAVHDRCLAFLFGAGTSSAINIAPDPAPGEARKHTPLIPGVLALTELCRSAVSGMGTNHAKAWHMLAEQCTQNDQTVNIETILSRVRAKVDAIGDGEILVGLDSSALEQFEQTVCSTIAKNVNPSEENIPDQIPHDALVEWVQRANRTAPLEIFTTNYDILFERAFEHASVPVFDGFVGAHEPFFYPDCLDDNDLLPQPKWIRLWKLHGSVNWKLKKVSGRKRKRVIRDRPSESGEMILPSHLKYDESRKQPYTSYMDRLASVLKAEHSLVITCGYGFGDEHINALLYGILETNPTSHVIALWFGKLLETDDLAEEARQRSNLTVIGPNAGVISGQWGEWRLTQPVDKKTHAFMDTAFDSKAVPDDESSPAAATDDLEGNLRLGDFNWFCQFLSEMSPSSQ